VYLRAVVRLFFGNNAWVLLALPLIIFGYVWLNFQTGNYVQEETSNLGFWGEALVIYPVLAGILSAVLIFINAVSINWIYNSNEFMDRNSYLSSLLYVVLLSYYHSFYSIDGLLLSHTFLILMMNRLFSLSQHEDGKREVFNGMFLAGMAATFHPPLMGLFPLLLFMIWVIRPFVMREFILAIGGFSIPLLYAGVYLWLSGNDLELKLLEQVTDYTNKQTDFLITAILFTLLFLLSIVSIRLRTQKSSLRLKKLINILWWFLLLGLILGGGDYIMYGQIERFSFIMIPLSIFMTFAFIHKTYGMFATILFYFALIYSGLKFFI